MAAGYSQSLRHKHDLEKQLHVFERETRSHLNDLMVERQYVEGGLLDLQSKTRNLNDAISGIIKQLTDEKSKAESDLRKLQSKRLHQGNQARRLTRHSLTRFAEQEKHLLDTIQHHNIKLRLLTIETSPPQIEKSMNVVLSSNRGLKAMLMKIRDRNKESGRRTSETNAVVPSANPQNIVDLMESFKLLPKIYPTKPVRKCPEKAQQMLHEYAEKKKQREQAMNYGTRKRIKRVEHHCESLKVLYCSTEKLHENLPPIHG